MPQPIESNPPDIDALCRLFPWPPGAEANLESLRDVHRVIDTGALCDTARRCARDGRVAMAFASKDYIGVAEKWIEATRRCGVENFFILTVDAETEQRLNALGVATVRFTANAGNVSPSYRTRTGFSAFATSIITLKYTIIAELVRNGFDVLFSDLDAIWCADPWPYLPKDVDLCFQRIMAHPQAFAQCWGFAACSGFMFIRSSPATENLMRACIAAQAEIVCDQTALNLGLWRSQPQWNFLPQYQAQLERLGSRLLPFFSQNAGLTIEGSFADGAGKMIALDHDRFWRHPFVPSRNMIVCHPNSRKADAQKLPVLEAVLSNRRTAFR
jgi:hypothetical protein